jgi:hypothetical protein
MSEKRFSELRDGLLKAGISRRNVRRAVLEVEDHFNELAAEASARGLDENHARLQAHEALGANQLLIERYAARPELRAWPNRWPAMWFILVPSGCYLAISAAAMAMLFAAVSQMSAQLHQIHIAPRVTFIIALIARVLFLGFFPASIAAVFGVLAYRRRIPLRWPVAGILLVSLLASLINVEFTLTGGSSAGQIGAGAGVSCNSLIMQSARALMVAALAFTPLWISMRCRRRGRAASR